MLWHGEPVLPRGAPVGHVTSAGIAPTLGSGSVGLAWVHGAIDGEDWTVQVRDGQVPATVQLAPFHDPKGDRAKA